MSCARLCASESPSVLGFGEKESNTDLIESRRLFGGEAEKLATGLIVSATTSVKIAASFFTILLLLMDLLDACSDSDMLPYTLACQERVFAFQLNLSWVR